MLEESDGLNIRERNEFDGKQGQQAKDKELTVDLRAMDWDGKKQEDEFWKFFARTTSKALTAFLVAFRDNPLYRLKPRVKSAFPAETVSSLNPHKGELQPRSEHSSK